MELDLTARRNLELTETLRSKEKKWSLLWVLDKTKTPMGGRMLRSWLERPLLSVTAITRRSGAVGQLVDHTMTREELALALTGIGDMERLVGRIVYGTAGGRDVVSLKNAMARLPHVKELLSAFDRGRLGELAQLDPLEDLTDLIGRTLCDDPPFSVREGEFIRDGFDPEVDRLRSILHGGKGVIASMEAAEKEKTGIRTLKIGYNKVFGYYIEVSNSFKDQVPDTYIRKQTLVNGERPERPRRDEERRSDDRRSKVVNINSAAHNGVTFRFDTRVERIRRTQAGYTLETNRGTMETRAVISAAGVWGDVLHNQVCSDTARIVPRRGEYCLLDKKDGGLVQRTVFQLPGPMGKGVLVTPTVHGNLLVGPTAADQEQRDLTATTAEGLAFAQDMARKSVPGLPLRDVITSFAGLRAHLAEGDDDFRVGQPVPGYFEALGIESPGLSSAPAIGAYLAEQAAAYLNARQKQNFDPVRRDIVHLRELPLRTDTSTCTRKK